MRIFSKNYNCKFDNCKFISTLLSLLGDIIIGDTIIEKTLYLSLNCKYFEIYSH